MVANRKLQRRRGSLTLSLQDPERGLGPGASFFLGLRQQLPLLLQPLLPLLLLLLLLLLTLLLQALLTGRNQASELSEETK